MGNVIKLMAHKERKVVEKVGDIMSYIDPTIEWLKKYDESVAKRRAEDVADMLRRGKTVDFCGYSYELVKNVEDKMLAAAK